MTPAELKQLYRDNLAAKEDRKRKDAEPFIAELEKKVAERDARIAELEAQLAAAKKPAKEKAKKGAAK